jgi:maltooligosyltrehalose trehalohydrolase
MLFQGQEYGSSSPFTYFADHEGDLRDAVEKGRLEFMSQFPAMATTEMRSAIPPPADRATFDSCKLRDDERRRDTTWHRLHRDLLRLRHFDDVLRDVGTDRVVIDTSAPRSSILLVRYTSDVGDRLLVVNFADEYRCAMNDPLFAPVPGRSWAQLWSSEQVQYGGAGATSIPDADPWLLPATSALLFATA